MIEYNLLILKGILKLIQAQMDFIFADMSIIIWFKYV